MSIFTYYLPLVDKGGGEFWEQTEISKVRQYPLTLQKKEKSTKWPWESWGSNRYQTRPTYQHIVVCIESSKMMYDKVFLSNWLPWSKHEQEIWRGTEHVLCECNYQLKSRNIFPLHLEYINVILIIISKKYIFLE